MIGRDLLGIEDLDRSEIERLLDTADHMREIGEREVKKVPTLRGRTIINLFFEPSTRTRASFEIAGKRLSADVINFSPSASSMKKAESILDTAKTLEAMDALMDFGRPRAVQVVGLVDRGHRELPIKLDYVGKNVPTRANEQVQLRNVDGEEDRLELVIIGAPEGDTQGGES